MAKGRKRRCVQFLMLFLLLFYQKVKIRTKEASKYKADLKRMQKLYSLLNQWIVIEICGKHMEKPLEERGYKTAAVYGMGELGQRLAEKLEIGSNLTVIYGIDRNAAKISTIVPVYDLESALKLSKPDVVILTIYSKDEGLLNALRTGFSCPVMRLEDLLNETK